MRFLLLALLMVAAGCRPPVPDSGPEIYRSFCATCHGADGAGVEGAFPPLNGTEWVTGDKGRLIRLALRGLRGPIEVDGKRYNNAMPPHAFLTDAQMAAVLTYVRQRFGTAADSVSADEVARVRAAEPPGAMYTADVLEGRTGIPD